MRFLKTNLLLIFLLFLCGCAKEDLPINQANHEDLKYSYYKLAANTIELSESESKSLVVSKTDNEISINTSSLEKKPQAGDIIVSEWGISVEDFVMRKIVSIQNENGDEITYQTEEVGLVEAYSEYYFNSKNEEVIRLRTSTLEIISEDMVSSLASAIGLLKDAGLLSFDVAPKLEFVGEVNWEAIHPNTAYTIFCNLPNCKNNPQKTDNNNNKVWDVAETFFGTIDPKILKDGLITLEFSDFSIQSYGLLISKNLNGPEYSAKPSNEILQKMQLEEEIAKVIDKDLSNHLGLIFSPTPLVYPPFSITGVVAPFFDFSMKGLPYFDISCIPNKTVDIQFGHINWTSSIPDLVPDFRVIDNNQDVNLTELILPAEISYTIGFTGEVNLDAGVGLGAAISIGEANKAGASLGGLLKIGSYKNLTGDLALKVNDAVNTSISEGDLTGSACFDIGFIHEPIVFTDFNTPDGILGAFFDYQLSVPIPLLGNRTSLFEFANEPVGIDNKLCLGESSVCNGTVQVYTNIAKDEFSIDGECVIEFKFANNKVTVNDAFELSVIVDETEHNLGKFSYNDNHSKVLPIEYQNILSASEDGNLLIKIVDVTALCDREFNDSKIGFIDICETSFTEINSESATFHSLNEEPIKYYKFEVLAPLIQSFSLFLPTQEELTVLLQEKACKNPVGLLVDNSNGIDPYVKVNSHLGYYWVQNELNEPIVLEAQSAIVNGNATWSSFKLVKVSKSSYACLLLE